MNCIQSYNSTSETSTLCITSQTISTIAHNSQNNPFDFKKTRVDIFKKFIKYVAVIACARTFFIVVYSRAVWTYENSRVWEYMKSFLQRVWKRPCRCKFSSTLFKNEIQYFKMCLSIALGRCFSATRKNVNNDSPYKRIIFQTILSSMVVLNKFSITFIFVLFVI